MELQNTFSQMLEQPSTEVAGFLDSLPSVEEIAVCLTQYKADCSEIATLLGISNGEIQKWRRETPHKYQSIAREKFKQLNRERLGQKRMLGLLDMYRSAVMKLERTGRRMVEEQKKTKNDSNLVQGLGYLFGTDSEKDPLSDSFYAVMQNADEGVQQRSTTRADREARRKSREAQKKGEVRKQSPSVDPPVYSTGRSCETTTEEMTESRGRSTSTRRSPTRSNYQNITDITSAQNQEMLTSEGMEQEMVDCSQLTNQLSAMACQFDGTPSPSVDCKPFTKQTYSLTSPHANTPCLPGLECLPVPCLQYRTETELWGPTLRDFPCIKVTDGSRKPLTPQNYAKTLCESNDIEAIKHQLAEIEKCPACDTNSVDRIQLQKHLQNCLYDMEKLTNKSFEDDSKIDSLECKISELRCKLNACRCELAVYKDKRHMPTAQTANIPTNDLETQLKRVLEEKLAIQAELQSMESMLKETMLDRDNIRQTNATLKTDVSQFKHENDMLNRSLQKLDQYSQTLQNQIKSYQHNLSHVQQELIISKNRESEMYKLKCEIENDMLDLEQSKHTNQTTKQKELDLSKECIKSYENQIEELKNSLARSNGAAAEEVQNWREMSERLHLDNQITMDTLKEENERIEKELDEARQKIIELSEQLMSQRTATDDMIKQYEREKDELRLYFNPQNLAEAEALVLRMGNDEKNLCCEGCMEKATAVSKLTTMISEQKLQFEQQIKETKENQQLDYLRDENNNLKERLEIFQRAIEIPPPELEEQNQHLMQRLGCLYDEIHDLRNQNKNLKMMITACEEESIHTARQVVAVAQDMTKFNITEEKVARIQQTSVEYPVDTHQTRNQQTSNEVLGGPNMADRNNCVGIPMGKICHHIQQTSGLNCTGSTVRHQQTSCELFTCPGTSSKLISQGSSGSQNAQSAPCRVINSGPSNEDAKSAPSLCNNKTLQQSCGGFNGLEQACMNLREQNETMRKEIEQCCKSCQKSSGGQGQAEKVIDRANSAMKISSSSIEHARKTGSHLKLQDIHTALTQEHELLIKELRYVDPDNKILKELFTEKDKTGELKTESSKDNPEDEPLNDKEVENEEDLEKDELTRLDNATKRLKEDLKSSEHAHDMLRMQKEHLEDTVAGFKTKMTRYESMETDFNNNVIQIRDLENKYELYKQCVKDLEAEKEKLSLKEAEFSKLKMEYSLLKREHEIITGGPVDPKLHTAYIVRLRDQEIDGHKLQITDMERKLVKITGAHNENQRAQQQAAQRNVNIKPGKKEKVPGRSVQNADSYNPLTENKSQMLVYMAEDTARMSAKIKALTEENARLHEDLTGRESELYILTTQLNKLKHGGVEGLVTEYTDKIQEGECEMARINQKLMLLTQPRQPITQDDDYVPDIEERTYYSQKLQEILGSLEIEDLSKAAEIKRILDHLDDLEATKFDLEQSLKSANHLKSELIPKLKKDILNLNTAREQAIADLEKTTRELKENKTHMEQAVRDKEEAERRFEMDLVQIRAERDKALNDIVINEKQNRSLVSQNEHELTRLKKDLNNKSASCQEREGALTYWKLKCEDLIREIKDNEERNNFIEKGKEAELGALRHRITELTKSNSQSAINTQEVQNILMQIRGIQNKHLDLLKQTGANEQFKEDDIDAFYKEIGDLCVAMVQSLQEKDTELDLMKMELDRYKTEKDVFSSEATKTIAEKQNQIRRLKMDIEKLEIESARLHAISEEELEKFKAAKTTEIEKLKAEMVHLEALHVNEVESVKDMNVKMRSTLLENDRLIKDLRRQLDQLELDKAELMLLKDQWQFDIEKLVLEYEQCKTDRYDFELMIERLNAEMETRIESLKKDHSQAMKLKDHQVQAIYKELEKIAMERGDMTSHLHAALQEKEKKIDELFNKVKEYDACLDAAETEYKHRLSKSKNEIKYLRNELKKLGGEGVRLLEQREVEIGEMRTHLKNILKVMEFKGNTKPGSELTLKKPTTVKAHEAHLQPVKSRGREGGDKTVTISGVTTKKAHEHRAHSSGPRRPRREC